MYVRGVNKKISVSLVIWVFRSNCLFFQVDHCCHSTISRVFILL